MSKSFHLHLWNQVLMNFPCGPDSKPSVYKVGDRGSIPSCEDPLEKEMAIHSRTIAWKIPWTEEPGRLQSMGSQKIGHDWVTSLSLSLSETRKIQYLLSLRNTVLCIDVSILSFKFWFCSLFLCLKYLLLLLLLSCCFWLFSTPWVAAFQASLSFTISQSMLKLMSIELVMPSNNFILCNPLLSLPSIFPSIRVFSRESALHSRWPKYWSFSISPSNEYSGLISFTIDWFNLLAFQGTLKSLLQHHNSKTSILWHQPSLWSNSHIYMTTGKYIDLTIQTFLAKWYLCFLIHCLGFS